MNAIALGMFLTQGLALLYWLNLGFAGKKLNYPRSVHGTSAHRKVAAGRSCVPRQMVCVFLSDNISLFTKFARVKDVIITSHSK